MSDIFSSRAAAGGVPSPATACAAHNPEHGGVPA
jgi:hypothetical protein